MDAFLPRRLVGGLFLLLGAALLGGCGGSTTDLSSDSHYASLVGRRYRTKVDTYVYTTTTVDHTYLGLNDPRLPHRDSLLPSNVAHKFIGKANLGANIIDVVPAGAELAVESVVRDASDSGVRVLLVCLLKYDGNKAERIDAFPLQANGDGRDPAPPQLHPLVAEPLP